MKIKTSLMNAIDRLTYQKTALMDHVYDIQLIVLSVDHDAI